MSTGKLLNFLSYWRHLKHSYTLGKPFTMICNIKKKKFFFLLNSMENGVAGRVIIVSSPTTRLRKHAQGSGSQERGQNWLKLKMEDHL